jgi:hypothetical protein
VLFCWVQLGNPDIAKEYIAEAIQDEDGFLSALEAMRGWQNSSDTGVTHPLRDDTIAHFLDADEAYTRLKSLSVDNNRKSATRQRASALLASLQRTRSSFE